MSIRICLFSIIIICSNSTGFDFVLTYWIVLFVHKKMSMPSLLL